MCTFTPSVPLLPCLLNITFGTKQQEYGGIEERMWNQSWFKVKKLSFGAAAHHNTSPVCGLRFLSYETIPPSVTTQEVIIYYDVGVRYGYGS